MKKISLLTLGAALIAAPVFAAPGPGARGDADANGTLTRAEAQAHANEMFARMDANKDGRLDASDRAGSRQELDRGREPVRLLLPETRDPPQAGRPPRERDQRRERLCRHDARPEREPAARRC